MGVSVDLQVGGFQANGTLQTSFLLPPAIGSLGTTFHAQALGLDPGRNALGAVVSNALTCTIGN